MISEASHYQPRYLKREWRRTKPHLPRHASLPTLHLVPRNRPLFQCGSCGWSNHYIDVCLWCAWSSQEASQDFLSRIPQRYRRFSTDCRLCLEASSVDKVKAERPATSAVAPTLSAFSASSARSSSVAKPHGGDITSAIGLGADGIEQEAPPSAASLRLPKYAHPTPPPITSTVNDGLLLNTGSASVPRGAARRPPRLPLLRSRRQRTSAASVVDIFDPLTPDELAFIMNNRSQSTPPRPSSAHSSMSSAPPAPNVRLGHPSRPYYTAIRKNMSPPASLLSHSIDYSNTAATTRSPSPPPTSPPLLTPSDCEEPPVTVVTADYASSSSLRGGRPSLRQTFSHPSSGFSLSGETELRMELARYRSTERTGERPTYLFQDTRNAKKGFGRRIRDSVGRLRCMLRVRRH